MKQQLSHFGIGASEIAAIAGLNPYASPWDIYLRKIDESPEEPGNYKMEWGHRLEPAIRQKYVDDTSTVVHVPDSSLYHRSFEWARATPDGIALALRDGEDWTWDRNDSKRWLHLLQCKNVGTWVERAWSEAPPPYVQLQEQWEMFVTGTPRADIAVLIGGSDFRIYTVHRENKVIDDLFDIAKDFWKRVETRTPPPIDDSSACREHFERKFARKDAIELVADEDTEALFSTWRSLHVQSKDIGRKIETIRNEVRKHLAEAQADRISSSMGTAKLQSRGGKATTNWELVAQLVGVNISQADFDEIVKANTTVTPESLTLIAPRDWAKEAI